MAEIDVCRAVGARPGGDHDLLRVQLLGPFMGITHQHGVLVLEARGTEEHVDAIASIEARAHLDLLLDGTTRTFQHLGEGEPARLTDVAEHAIGVELDDLLDRVTQGLGGDGALVGAVAAHGGLGLDHGHSLAMLGRIDRRALPCRTGTDHDHIVVVDCHETRFAPWLFVGRP